MLSVIMLSVIMLSVVMLNVVAPLNVTQNEWNLKERRKCESIESPQNREHNVVRGEADTEVKNFFLLLRCVNLRRSKLECLSVSSRVWYFARMVFIQLCFNEADTLKPSSILIYSTSEQDIYTEK
jgi:hypothetical protein